MSLWHLKVLFFSAYNIECRLPRQRKGPEPGSYTPRDERIVRRTKAERSE